MFISKFNYSASLRADAGKCRLPSLTFNPAQTCRRKGMCARQRGDSHASPRNFLITEADGWSLSNECDWFKPIVSYLWALIGWRGAKNGFWRWRLRLQGFAFRREVVWTEVRMFKHDLHSLNQFKETHWSRMLPQRPLFIKSPRVSHFPITIIHI